MEFDIVTWSIWIVGFTIWVVWTYFSVRELKVLLRAHREERDDAPGAPPE